MSEPITIVDTSIWMDHIDRADDLLVELLREGRILFHPMVIGEIMLGPLHHGGRILEEPSERRSVAADLD